MSRALRMAELADRLGPSPSATTRLVDRLEERGWVRRESARQDRRTIDVLLTTDGRRAYVRNNRPFTAAVEEAVTARMSDEEMTQLIGLLGPPMRRCSVPQAGRRRHRLVSLLRLLLLPVRDPSLCVIALAHDLAGRLHRVAPTRSTSRRRSRATGPASGRPGLSQALQPRPDPCLHALVAPRWAAWRAPPAAQCLLLGRKQDLDVAEGLERPSTLVPAWRRTGHPNVRRSGTHGMRPIGCS